MSVKFTSPSSVTVTGTTYENEPVIKSDGASSDVMEWAASTGSSSIKIRENSANDLVLDVEGNLELADRVASASSSITVGAVFLYSTKDDSDGGAWRKKTSHTSWAREGSSTTRSARSEFPAMCLIVADDDGVTIYDADDPSLPAWLVANVSGESSSPNKMTALGGGTIGNISSAFALNGRIYLTGGSTTGSQSLLVWNFVEDYYGNYDDAAARGGRAGTIAERNAQVVVDGSFNTIVDSTVNDVSATILEGAEIGALGLPIPTVAVATAGGVSVIHPSGDVYDLTSTGHTNDDVENVFFTEDGQVGYAFAASASQTSAFSVGTRKVPFADSTISAWDSTNQLERYNPVVSSSVTGLTTNTSAHTTTGAGVNAVTPTGKDGLAIGYGDRLSVIKRNPGNMEEGAVAYITSTYNTGYMVGDIRFALADGDYLDRSVKANTIGKEGSVANDTAVATGAELKCWNDFSASNYLTVTDANLGSDLDFGTGDFSIMLWVKDSDATEPQNLVSRSDASQVAGDWLIQAQSDGSIDFYRHSGSGWVLDASTTSPATPRSTATGAVVANQWTQVVAVKRSSKFYWYINGKLSGTPQADANSFTSNSALTIGHSLGQTSEFADNSSLSLVRISATAPTPQQIKEIYEAEKPLFAEDAKCLLASGHSTYSNEVKDLSFDKQTGLLTVTQTALTGGNADEGSQQFRGLERVGYVVDGTAHGWTYRSTTLVSSAGGVTAMLGPFGDDGGVLVDLPSIDVRAELNEGESKIPDDGKLHFEGVTTDATPAAIGQIPIAEMENVVIRAKVRGQRYNSPTSSWWLIGEIVQNYYRNIGANVVEPLETPTLSLIDEGQASLNFTLEEDTASNTVKLMVTGTSSFTDPIVWTAEVEVQRISEKTYER